jgi:hypothetical protein
MLREIGSSGDGIHFHYHPHAFTREAHRSATHWWASSGSLYQVLSRRVIDRQWFPAANRPGFHAIRPDSHWFLEQFLPFDFANQAGRAAEDDAAQFGVGSGRLGDWRRAPATWEPYHPDHDDYQVPGGCRRWVARCLNIGTRYRLLAESDVRQAFSEAAAGKPVVLAFTNHDFRDIRPDVEGVRGLIAAVAAEFPEVPFRYAEALEAMRAALRLAPEPPCELTLSLERLDSHTHVLTVESDTPTFGPQPWLALKTASGTYHHDNFDIHEPFHSWGYVLDEETFPLQALAAVGVAANNSVGTTTVTLLDPASGRVSTKHWNLPATAGPRPGSNR